MGFFNMFDKLDDIIYKPIEAMTDWAKEPLKKWEGEREIKGKEADVNMAIKKETQIKKALAEIDEFKKDKEFERMKAVSESIMK